MSNTFQHHNSSFGHKIKRLVLDTSQQLRTIFHSKINSFIQLKRSQRLELILGLVVLVMVIIGGASAYFLSFQKQDVRQQARMVECTEDVDCSSGYVCRSNRCVRKNKPTPTRHKYKPTPTSSKPSDIPKPPRSTQAPKPTNTPKPRGQVRCSWGSEGSVACSNAVTCVKCVNKNGHGYTQVVSRSECSGKVCGLSQSQASPTPTSVSSAPDNDDCLSRFGAKIICLNGYKYMSECPSDRRYVCKGGLKQATPSPSVRPTQTPTPTRIANAVCGPCKKPGYSYGDDYEDGSCVPDYSKNGQSCDYNKICSYGECISNNTPTNTPTPTQNLSGYEHLDYCEQYGDGVSCTVNKNGYRVVGYCYSGRCVGVSVSHTPTPTPTHTPTPKPTRKPTHTPTRVPTPTHRLTPTVTLVPWQTYHPGSWTTITTPSPTPTLLPSYYHHNLPQWSTPTPTRHHGGSAAHSRAYSYVTNTPTPTSVPSAKLSCAGKKKGDSCFLPGGDKGTCDTAGYCVYSKEKNLPPTPTYSPIPTLAGQASRCSLSYRGAIQRCAQNYEKCSNGKYKCISQGKKHDATLDCPYKSKGSARIHCLFKGGYTDVGCLSGYRCESTKQKIQPVPTGRPTPVTLSYLPTHLQLPTLTPTNQPKQVVSSCVGQNSTTVVCIDSLGRTGYCRQGICIAHSSYVYTNSCTGKQDGSKCTSSTGKKGTCGAGYCQVTKESLQLPVISPTSVLSGGGITIISSTATPTPTLVSMPTLVSSPTPLPSPTSLPTGAVSKMSTPAVPIIYSTPGLQVVEKVAKNRGMTPYVVYPNSGDSVIEALYQALKSNQECGQYGCWMMTVEDTPLAMQLPGAPDIVIVRADYTKATYDYNPNHYEARIDKMMAHEKEHTQQAANGDANFANVVHCPETKCHLFQALIEGDAESVSTVGGSDYEPFRATYKTVEQIAQEAGFLDLFMDVSKGNNTRIDELVNALQQSGVSVDALLRETGVL